WFTLSPVLSASLRTVAECLNCAFSPSPADSRDSRLISAALERRCSEAEEVLSDAELAGLSWAKATVNGRRENASARNIRCLLAVLARRMVNFLLPLDAARRE